MGARKTAYAEDALQTYCNEIKRIPLLSLEEELELTKRSRQGDSRAKEKLIRANLRLVVAIARHFAGTDIAFMDIVQEGNMGLMRAAEKYDPAKNARFVTYAGLWIRQYISRFLSSKRRNIRLPHRKEQQSIALMNARQTLSQTLMREPTVQELAEEVGLSAKDAALILTMTNGNLPLETENKAEETVTVLDTHEDYTYNPEREFFRRFTQDNTVRLLDRLKTREKWILMYRYQLKGCQRYTLRRLGEKLNLSPETIRQIEKKALKEIRSYGEEFRETLCGEAM
ncbi:MAG: RNA polymerase sigma factor RpoD/SigA [Spirochaetaceae bacterium]|jgi:RNA polymerase primary sigma factor|nr:RNA polymerase sigma factor RpoD/SigA [Spirochaetaceae bacterium]